LNQPTNQPGTEMDESGESRRAFVKKAAYVAPAVLTLPAAPAYAKHGSEKLRDWDGEDHDRGHGNDKNSGRGNDRLESRGRELDDAAQTASISGTDGSPPGVGSA